MSKSNVLGFPVTGGSRLIGMDGVDNLCHPTFSDQTGLNKYSLDQVILQTRANLLSDTNDIFNLNKRIKIPSRYFNFFTNFQIVLEDSFLDFEKVAKSYVNLDILNNNLPLFNLFYSQYLSKSNFMENFQNYVDLLEARGFNDVFELSNLLNSPPVEPDFLKGSFDLSGIYYFNRAINSSPNSRLDLFTILDSKMNFDLASSNFSYALLNFELNADNISNHNLDFLYYTPNFGDDLELSCDVYNSKVEFLDDAKLLLEQTLLDTQSLGVSVVCLLKYKNRFHNLPSGSYGVGGDGGGTRWAA